MPAENDRAIEHGYVSPDYQVTLDDLIDWVDDRRVDPAWVGEFPPYTVTPEMVADDHQERGAALLSLLRRLEAEQDAAPDPDLLLNLTEPSPAATPLRVIVRVQLTPTTDPKADRIRGYTLDLPNGDVLSLIVPPGWLPSRAAVGQEEPSDGNGR